MPKPDYILHHGDPVEPITSEALVDFPHVNGVIVHPGQRWIWMKPGKTGGTSIFRKGLPEGWICGGRTYQPEAYRKWLTTTTDADLSEYRVWTIIRNPWDRLFSALAYFHIDDDDFAHDPLRYLSPGLWAHIIPQHIYMRHCHVIGLFDDLEASYRYIAQWLGFRPIKKLPHLNRSRKEEKGDMHRVSLAQLLAQDLIAIRRMQNGRGYEQE